MKYTIHENLSETCGTISNLHGFLHRFNDGGFKTKWSGYWVPPYKFLDYYGIKINGVWLSSETLEATEYGEKFVFHHETGSLSITEKVLTPEKLPGFRVELGIENKTDEPKAVRIGIEPGVDIRHRSEDIGPEDYEVEQGANRITFSKNDRKLMVSAEDSFSIEGNRYLKEHVPGEKQRCLVPGEIVFRNEVGPKGEIFKKLEFSTSDGSFDGIERRQQEFEHHLGRTFDSCVQSMENLVYDKNGKGIIAGHPWFQSYWARDSFWSLLGLIDAGHFELARHILENFVENNLNSRIHLDRSKEKDFPRADTAPLFIIASQKLRKHFRITDKIETGMQDAMQKLELEGKIVRHEPEATWMDTLERSPAVDIQSLWLEAAKIAGHPSEDKLREGLREFMEEDYMKDYLGDDAPRTINAAVPLMFGQVRQEKAEKYLEKINAEFTSRYGARTRSMADPGYESHGYHTGSVWGLTTGWAAAANFRYGKYTQGLNLLEKMTQFLDRNQLGALPEVVDAETGELLGATEQAWSAGMFVHAVDSYLLGISPGSEKIRVDAKPDIDCTRRNKRLGDQEIDLKFEDGKAEIEETIDREIINHPEEIEN